MVISQQDGINRLDTVITKQLPVTETPNSLLLFTGSEYKPAFAEAAAISSRDRTKSRLMAYVQRDRKADWALPLGGSALNGRPRGLPLTPISKLPPAMTPCLHSFTVTRIAVLFSLIMPSAGL
jgi:hypothetical protein